MRDKVRNTKRESLDARNALKSVLTQDINRINNDLASRLNNATIELNLLFMNVMEEANVTGEDVENLKLKVADQKKILSGVESKAGANSDALDSLKERSEADREKIKNVTNSYTKIVLLTKSYLTNSTAEPEKIQEILTSLEETMNILQDSRVREAIGDFNRTLQVTMKTQNSRYTDDIRKVSNSTRSLAAGLTDYLYKSLGYVLIPNAGYYHVSASTPLTFRFSLGLT